MVRAVLLSGKARQPWIESAGPATGGSYTGWVGLVVEKQSESSSSSSSFVARKSSVKTSAATIRPNQVSSMDEPRKTASTVNRVPTRAKSFNNQCEPPVSPPTGHVANPPARLKVYQTFYAQSCSGGISHERERKRGGVGKLYARDI